ncbi:hypothetical protein HYPSUDRAFT_1090757 [Hypholoma sublateritium FD-334 SS-4]|uniref:Lytic polysaccharide monooxygenase n=1 Tax=Hypholoma sublateritium (strain FD-334 SS-4) TaxID=945553 RepID=A0A0D2MB47_HYPSF|nr:hypothetical protein HYPSUDRAFT_1090757 [Hypholoma sublateritium FD-334 SS-4]
MSMTLGRRCLARALYIVAGILLWSHKLVWVADAHVAAWHKGMYCLNGTEIGIDDDNTNSAVQPLYQLHKTDWWMHHFNGCDGFPPVDGDFLELQHSLGLDDSPANGEFTVELAVNRAFTTLSYNASKAAIYGDGQDHPGLGITLEGKRDNLVVHAQNESMAAGTIFAISYTSDINQVTEDSLVVFTVLPNTPWQRLATYHVPNLPACPDRGCICSWGWVADNCGEPNMYMEPFKCKVTGSTGDRSVSRATAPIWCEGNQSQCVGGAKQMVFYNQLEGNNVEVSGTDRSGQPKSPTYNTKMGFTAGKQHHTLGFGCARWLIVGGKLGAQNDIFNATATVPTTFIPPLSTPTQSSKAHIQSLVKIHYTWFFFSLWTFLGIPLP